MSVDINWETLTGGSDGQALAETVRDFIHERFQNVSFPKLIRSVKVQSFDFGTTPPEIVLKDVCNPLPDFYETDDEVGERHSSANPDAPQYSHVTARAQADPKPPRSRGDHRRPSELELFGQASTSALTRGAILGGASNLGYFNLSGFSGTTTPLAAVAGAHFNTGSLSLNGQSVQPRHYRSVSSSSIASPPSRPISRDHSYFDSRHASAVLDGHGDETSQTEQASHEQSPDDMQVVFHITYAGDVRLSLTAEVHLDYPMPSFVGIPLKLNITGMTFNGVGVLAYIKKRAHLSFLSPEDAEALVGSVGDAAVSPGGDQSPPQPSRVGGLLEEIKIESEMGESGEGKQVLKNVGKIEKFVLEQVQRIFEEEFVYPSFWTFLV